MRERIRPLGLTRELREIRVLSVMLNERGAVEYQYRCGAVRV